MTTTLVTTKSVFQSKTIWINVITLATLAISAVMGSEIVKDYPTAVTVGGMVITGLNIALRWLTDRPVSIGGNDIRTLKG